MGPRYFVPLFLRAAPPFAPPLPRPAAFAPGAAFAAGTAAPRLGLDQCVRPREHQPGVPVVEADQVGRLPRLPVHLDDLAALVRVADTIPANEEPVSNCCLHAPASLR